MNEIGRKPAHTVTELASARQHQENPSGGGRSGQPTTVTKEASLVALVAV